MREEEKKSELLENEEKTEEHKEIKGRGAQWRSGVPKYGIVKSVENLQKAAHFNLI